MYCAGARTPKGIPIAIACWRNQRRSVRYGAEGGTRTPTVLRPSAPQAGASANSATSAIGGLDYYSIRAQNEGAINPISWPEPNSPESKSLERSSLASSSLGPE